MTAPAPWLQALHARFAKAIADGRLSHALLIAGEPGLGKRDLARRMAARLLCRTPAGDDACGRCPACIWLAAGSHPDFVEIGPEEDSDTIKVDQIRALSEYLQLTAQAGAARVALIAPADAMNMSAQNALLKTLEEPPPGVHLILVADAPARLLPTVRSRCLSFTVAAPGLAAAREWLDRQGVAADANALALAAGHPGLALAYGEPGRARRAAAVAEDLHRLASGEATPLAVAGRWAEDAAGHVDDAIAWLRLWSWRAAGIDLHPLAPPAHDPLACADAYARALRLRERLRAPLKPAWLLHEWLSAWARDMRRAA